MTPEPDRAALLALLGGEVGQLQLDQPLVRSRDETQGYLTEDLLFHTSLGDPVPAYFIRPTDDRKQVPALLYCHAHGDRYDIGRGELLAGRPALQSPFAPVLRDLGCAVLCLEMPCFGERREPDESALAKAMLWRGQTLFGRMLAELVAGLDYLADHPAVDATRLGALGISMGGTHAWWLAALDDRVRAAVQMCCFADLDCLIDTGQHDGHGQYMTVPSLLQRHSTGRLAGLAAPRAQLVCAGMRDWSTPKTCFVKARAEIEDAYARAGAASLLEFHVEPDAGHEETPAMRRAVTAFLVRHLGA